MNVSIRPFRNTDLPVVCELWNRHHGFMGFMDTVAADQLELFVQAKPYFDQRQLLLAWRADLPLGFVHLSPLPDAGLEAPLADAMAIAALCVAPLEEEALVAAELLNAAAAHCRQIGARRCVFRPALPNCSFYIGLGPADSLAGTLLRETRVGQWVTAAGYEPALPTIAWELELANFRVPADRAQIQVRRSTLVERQLQEPTMPWWQSCVLGHADVTAYHLNGRGDKRPLDEVLVWTIAPALRQLPSRAMWLWPPTLKGDRQVAATGIASTDLLLFLLAESILDLQSERVDTLRTITPAEADPLHLVFSRLGFRAVESGMVYELQLPPSIESPPTSHPL